MAILSTGKIAKGTIAKQSFANLWNLITDTNNVPLPSGLPSTHKFVYRRMPFIGRNFDGFPFIIVGRSKPKKLGGVADMTKSFMNYDFVITVYTKDKDYNATGEPTAADICDDITSDIIETLNNATNRKSLLFNGMGHLEFDVDTDEEEFEGKAVYVSEFDIRFVNNLTTTT